jgi:hypothetical protein
LSPAVVVLLAAQGCTKTIYYAVLAPNQAMVLVSVLVAVASSDSATQMTP